MLDRLWGLIEKIDPRNPRFYVFLIIALVLILVIFPFIDANWLYFSRVSKRIDILDSITQIEADKLNYNSVIKAEYESVLRDIQNQKKGALDSIIKYNDTETVAIWKFITGGLCLWIAGICILFSKSVGPWKDRLGTCFAALIFGTMLGGVSFLIPTIISPIVNYISYPVLVVIAIVALTADRRQ